MITDLPPVFFFILTSPFCDTVAIFLLLEDQINFWFEAFAGVIDGVNLILCPTAILCDIPERVIFEINVVMLLNPEEESFSILS